jgi:hypothetical protein
MRKSDYWPEGCNVANLRLGNFAGVQLEIWGQFELP